MTTVGLDSKALTARLETETRILEQSRKKKATEEQEINILLADPKGETCCAGLGSKKRVCRTMWRRHYFLRKSVREGVSYDPVRSPWMIPEQ